MKIIRDEVDENKYLKNNYFGLEVEALKLSKDMFYQKGKDSIAFNTRIIETAGTFFEDAFQLTNKERFRDKFLEAISGDGGELTKMDALHSSSLCALLCFYNVSKAHPIKYEGIEYTDSYFEVKNKVYDNPSNMDVVLTSKNGAILFIECKFSEYIKSDSYKLKDKYIEDYGSVFERLKYNSLKGMYKTGLKQLVAHHKGLCNFIDGMNNEKYKEEMSHYYEDEDKRVDLYNKPFRKVSFIEVIYELKDDKNNKKFDAYHSKAKEVIDLLKTTDDRLQLYEPITYQDLFSGDNANVLDDKVKAYYRLGVK